MNIVIIPNFQELRLPHVDAGSDGQWCTCDKDRFGMFYLLNGDRYQLCDLGELEEEYIDSELNFESEADCHKAASKYYNSYGMTYPYMDEWHIAILSGVNETPIINKEVQSQTMVFK